MTDLDERHGALYRLLAVDCPVCGWRCSVPTGRGRLRIRRGLEQHLIGGHGWASYAASDLALMYVPRITEGSD